MQKLGHEINFVTFLGLIIMNLQFPLLVYAFFSGDLLWDSGSILLLVPFTH